VTTRENQPSEYPCLAERIMASPEADSNLGLATMLVSVVSLTFLIVQFVGSPGEFQGILLLVSAGLSAIGWYLLSTIDYLRGHRSAYRLWLGLTFLYICVAGLALGFIADAARAT
jgi:hypothetical protein